MPARLTSDVQSPCIKLCTLDAAGKTCLGCGRTVAEIATWSRLDDAARRVIMTRLADAKGNPAHAETLPP